MISADSIFARFRDNDSLTRTKESFDLGEAMTVGAAEGGTVVQSCRNDAPCEGEIRKMKPSQRAKRRDIRVIAKPDIAKFLATTFSFPTVTSIEEKTLQADSVPKGFIAEVTCHNHVARIRYAPDLANKFSPITFAFFRAHEVGHLALNHVTGCLPQGIYEVDPGLTVKKRELDADCKGASLIMGAIPTTGLSVIAFTSGQFSLLTLPQGEYPSWRARSDGLWRDECG